MWRLKPGLIALLLAALSPSAAQGQGAPALEVAPYLQLATPSSVWILWETSSGDESLVEWGPTEALGSSTTGVAQTTTGDARLHEVLLDGLVPATTYFYRASTGSMTSDVHRFTTPASPEDEEPLRFVAMSDMQRDSGNPDVFAEIVEQGIIGVINERFGSVLDQELTLALLAGDLVDDGHVHEQWRQDFFRPVAPLAASVPLYPVLGNHEGYSELYFTYFHLPENGEYSFEENWWTHDVGNIRLIGLDSNIGSFGPGQAEWLNAVLDDACDDDDIDFVFAQLHHPHRSELWPPGENGFTGDVGLALEEFSTRCDRPSVLFFGHTHGYSRGQSPGHRHLMVNVASAGGNIDYWGEYEQVDYEEFTVSQDEWGFVLVEVEAGLDPSMTLTRYSRGNEITARDNEVRDAVTIRLHDEAPNRPEALWPRGREINARCVVWQASSFSGGERDDHQATQWQLAETCTGFDTPLIDRWRQRQNWFNDVDTQADDDLTDEVLRDLSGNQSYCWRVRYRDAGLTWSEWSETARFTTSSLEVTAPLLVNPGAEDGTEGWTVVEGFLESLTADECNGTTPHNGTRYFAVGGLCDSAAYGEASQRVDLSEHRDEIDAGEAVAELVGWLRNYNGRDVPTLQVVFLDADDSELGRSSMLENATDVWTEVRDATPVPSGTRSVDVVLTGTRMSGADNDSYADDLSFRLSFSPEGECQEPGSIVDGDGDADADADGVTDADGHADADTIQDGDIHSDARQDSGAGGGGCDGCRALGRSETPSARADILRFLGI